MLKHIVIFPENYQGYAKQKWRSINKLTKKYEQPLTPLPCKQFVQRVHQCKPKKPLQQPASLVNTRFSFRFKEFFARLLKIKMGLRQQ